jgi:hypothetical protein
MRAEARTLLPLCGPLRDRSQMLKAHQLGVKQIHAGNVFRRQESIFGFGGE